MTEKQKRLLQLFREIDEICKKHNLRYVMAGGSLIGVVRNEGFIPWDDDVDIYMPKADWDKLVELAPKELPPHRAVQCVDTDRNYTNTFPRYASTDTCAIHRHQIIGKDKAGEIIDVLTLDPIPADDREYEKYRNHLMVYSDLINIAVVYGNRYEVPVTLYLKYLLSYLILGKDRTLKKLEKIMFSYKEEECDRYAMRWGGCPFLFDKDMMFPVKYGKFAGIDVMIPNKVSDYLIWHYGDEWSYIPPHGERESHDSVECRNMNYEEFRKEYMPGINTFKLRKDAVFRKIYYMATAKRSHRLVRKRQELMGEHIKEELEKQICESKVSLNELLEHRDFHKLNHIFKEYYQVQLSPDFIGREDFVHIYSFYHPCLIRVEDEAFLAAMYTLFYTERVSKAYRMLRVREAEKELLPEQKQLLDDIILFREAACHYEFREMDRSEELIDRLLEKYPEHPSFLKFKVRFLTEQAKQDKKTAKAREFLEYCLGLFPKDGYFHKYEGDLLWIEGQCRDALEIYAEVRDNTNNGIVWLELDKFLQEYKLPAMQTCQSLVENGEAKEGVALAGLWAKLLPGDMEIMGYGSLARVMAALNETAVCRELEDLKGLIEEYKQDSSYSTESREAKILYTAMVKGRERLGFSAKAAESYAELLFTDKTEDLEKLETKVRKLCSDSKEDGEYCLILGEILLKEGLTNQAFSFFLKGRKTASEYVAQELDRIILQDLKEGSKSASAYAARGDAREFLDSWLGKYGTLEEIQDLINTINRQRNGSLN